MSSFSSEAKVGIFVLAGIASLIYFSVRIGSLKLPSQEEGFRVTVFFDSIAGLDRKAAVRYAGIKIGAVDTILLEGDKAKVVLFLQGQVKIPADAIAEVGTLGLLGERYIIIRGGTANGVCLKEGDSLKGSEPVSIDQIVSSINSVGGDIKEITSSFKDVVATDEGRDMMRNILHSINDLTKGLGDLVSANRQQMDAVVRHIELLTRDLSQITHDRRTEIEQTLSSISQVSVEFERTIPEILSNLQQILAETNSLLKENRQNVSGSMDSLRSASARLEDTMGSLRTITQRVEAGEGTLGKLVNDDQTHENLNTTLTSMTETLDEAKTFFGRMSSYQAYLGYRGEYMGDVDKWRNIISIRVQPKRDKFYLLELVDTPFGHRSIEEYDITTESSTAGIETKHIREETVTDKMQFSLQVGRRFNFLTLRGGLIESSGGAGADLHLFNDHVRVSAEGYDFAEDRKAHLRFSTNFRFADYFEIGAGWDDPLNSDRSSYFVGGGLSFADDDFKFLLGLLPLASAGQ